MNTNLNFWKKRCFVYEYLYLFTNITYFSPKILISVNYAKKTHVFRKGVSFLRILREWRTCPTGRTYSFSKKTKNALWCWDVFFTRHITADKRTRRRRLITRRYYYTLPINRNKTPRTTTTTTRFFCGRRRRLWRRELACFWAFATAFLCVRVFFFRVNTKSE